MSLTQDVTRDDNNETARGEHDPRPEPRRCAEVTGPNSTWWRGLGWVLLVLAIVFPFPWWW